MRLDINRIWYRSHISFVALLLLPLSFLYRIILMIRRALYRVGLLRKTRFKVPVIVVGNITVGGTGKTPFVIWLAEWLRARGLHPGIVSRGVGGQTHATPHLLQASDTAATVGDEAILLSRRTHCPLVVCTDRVAAVQLLLQQATCDVVISDDGLQHLALERALEIVMVDGDRRFGNLQLLPAGPLREPLLRLRSVDMIVVNGGNSADPYVMTLQQAPLQSLNTGEAVSLSNFSGKTVHAVAGIGHPERFFATLRQAGLTVIPHAFPDHHAYAATDFKFDDSFPILMTEKDAVKCTAFADARFWYLPVSAQVNAALEQLLIQHMEKLHASNNMASRADSCST